MQSLVPRLVHRLLHLSHVSLASELSHVPGELDPTKGISLAGRERLGFVGNRLAWRSIFLLS